MFTCDDGEKVDERKTGGRSQVDRVSEVKVRWYRVSCKEASEQGQRCRNSIPEPRQERVIKTSSARVDMDRSTAPQTKRITTFLFPCIFLP